MIPQDLGRKWVPKDAAELLAAYKDGLLDEAHWCDLKKEATTNNKETARDLASFSKDGGTVFIGLDEDEPGGDPLHPVELAGLPERIERIALASVHPQLQISCTIIESGKHDGKGFVLVHIPPSAMAPHQVDGVYYGRGDKTKRRLSEPEVEQLYRRREQWNRDMGEMLAGHMMSDPLLGRTHPPHLYVVARSVGGRPDMARDLVSGPDWRGKIQTMKFNITREESIARLFREFGMHPQDSSFSADLPMMEKTHRGALLSNRLSPSTQFQPLRDRERRLEISEDGELRLFFNAAHQTFGVNDVEYTGLHLAKVVLIVRELLAVARYLSDRCGHYSAWDFGLGLDSMYGVRPMLNINNPYYSTDHPGYPAADYRQTTRASLLELEKTPGAVAERLAGQLYRTFDVTSERFLAVFGDVSEAEA